MLTRPESQLPRVAASSRRASPHGPPSRLPVHARLPHGRQPGLCLHDPWHTPRHAHGAAVDCHLLGSACGRVGVPRCRRRPVWRSLRRLHLLCRARLLLRERQAGREVSAARTRSVGRARARARGAPVVGLNLDERQHDGHVARRRQTATERARAVSAGAAKNAGREAAAAARMPSRSAAMSTHRLRAPPPRREGVQLRGSWRVSKIWARGAGAGKGAGAGGAHRRRWRISHRPAPPVPSPRSELPLQPPACVRAAWASAERTTSSRASSGGSKDARAAGVAAVPTPVVRGATSGSRSPALGGLASR